MPYGSSLPVLVRFGFAFGVGARVLGRLCGWVSKQVNDNTGLEQTKGRIRVKSLRESSCFQGKAYHWKTDGRTR